MAQALSGSKPQLLNQQHQVNAEFLGGFNLASRCGIPQACSGPLELLRRERTKFLHNLSLWPTRACGPARLTY